MFSFPLHAKDINTAHTVLNKDRIKKLDQGVAELGAERERARTIRQEINNGVKTTHKTNRPNKTTIRVISNQERLKKLEQGVAELGAERERIRAQK